MSVMYGRIYVIRNSVNSKQYVGKTIRTIAQRFNEHVACIGKCRAIESAIRKYGVGAFSIDELAAATSMEELNNLERFWIARLKSVAPAGYNLSAGGDGAGVMHEETKAIIRANARRPEHLARFAEMNSRPDVRAKMKGALITRWRDPAFKKKAGASISEALNRPAVKKQRSAALCAAWTDPQSKKTRVLAMMEVNARPAVKAKRAASMSRAWNEPGAREQRADAIRAAKSTTEFRARYAATNALAEVKARRSAASSARRATPEQRAARSVAQTGKKLGPQNRAYLTPEFRAKRGDAIRDAKRRKREALAA